VHSHFVAVSSCGEAFACSNIDGKGVVASKVILCSLRHLLKLIVNREKNERQAMRDCGSLLRKRSHEAMQKRSRGLRTHSRTNFSDWLVWGGMPGRGRPRIAARCDECGRQKHTAAFCQRKGHLAAAAAGAANAGGAAAQPVPPGAPCGTQDGPLGTRKEKHTSSSSNKHARP